MASMFSADKIRRHYMDKATRPNLLADLRAGIQTGHVRLDDLSLTDCFESLVPGGNELVRAMSYRKSGGMTSRDLVNVMEAGAGEAVNTHDFANITGQLIFNKVREEFNNPELINPQLCETEDTPFLYGERIPGVGGIGASAIETVGEGEEFPSLGVNEEYVDAPAMNKRGFIVPVTREMVIMDRTGLVVKRCQQGAKYLAINKEYRVIGGCTGQVNNYSRNGVTFNTYNTSGAFVNQLTYNPLVDWTSVEASELLFDGMSDPNTGLPIILPAAQILRPNGLKRTSQRILDALGVQHVDMRPNAATVRQEYDNPLKKGFYDQASYTALGNAYVRAVTNSNTRWFVGDFKKAILYRQAWGIEEISAADNNELQFTRDIWHRFKVSEMGVVFVQEPRWICSNHT